MVFVVDEFTVEWQFTREVERKDVSSTTVFKVPRCVRAIARNVLRFLDVLLDEIVCFLKWREREREREKERERER